MVRWIAVIVVVMVMVGGCSRGDRIVEDAGALPWPPPRASAVCNVPGAFFQESGGEVMLHDVLEKIYGALDGAGYEERQLCSVRDGFAVVTRIERFRKNGEPAEGGERWDSKIKPLELEINISGLKEYGKALFGPDVYCFRRIVFVVKPGQVNERNDALGPRETKNWVSSRVRSARVRDIDDIPFSANYRCTALIYEFEKYKMNDQLIPVETSHLLGKTHLEKSKVWKFLEQKQ